MTKLILSSLLLVLFFALPNTIFGTLIEDTCKAASQSSPNIKHDFCVSSLQAAPRGGAASSAVELGQIAIGLLQNNVTATKSRVTGLLNDPNQSPAIKSVLKDCDELYGDASSTTEEAAGSYEAKDYESVNIKISAVMDDSTTCEDGFSERPGLVSPLTSNNNNAFQLSAIVLAITNKLH